jgi:hypothetical protein
VVPATAARLNRPCDLQRVIYERKPEHFLAFVGTAAALICHRRLAKMNDV